MSPEMYNPRRLGGVSFPADLWAAACVLLQMLTGAGPYAECEGYAVRDFAWA